MQPLVVIDSFSYAYPGATDWVLRDISLTIAPGQCVLLEGPTGCGKTTLLMALRDLLPHGRTAGSIRGRPCDGSIGAATGLILQRPTTQLLYPVLGADIAFGLENHCVQSERMEELVTQSLHQVGLDRPLPFPVDHLSMGQQYRACTAGQLVLGPQLIMFDEPMAQLDPSGKEHLLNIIRQLKDCGRSVLICEHQGAMLQPVVDALWRMDAGGGVCSLPLSVLRQAGADSGMSSPKHDNPPKNAQAQEEESAIRLSGVRLFPHQPEGAPAALDIEIARGRRLVVSGPNGCGKSTLMRCLAGLAQPVAGKVHILGKPASLASLRGRLAVLFQDPKKQLFETTVFAEVAFAARRQGVPTEQLDHRVVSLLASLGIVHLEHSSPHLLSYGQKHLVGLAAVLAGEPDILLLDDPFAGLDAASVERVKKLVSRECAERNTTVVWTTHDPASLSEWADCLCELAPVVHGLSLEAQASPGSRERGASLITSRSRRRKPPISSGFLLALCSGLSIAAFTARSLAMLAGLSVVNLIILAVFSRNRRNLLLRSGKFFLWQGILVTLLYILRFGVAQGWGAGLVMAWQLFLAFWPGIIFMASNNSSEMARTMARFLPPRMAFVFTVCLRFMPMLLGEMREIREVQILRGAKLLVKDLRSPRAWPDWLHCLLVPTLVKTLALADEIALAAKSRDFGMYPQRTCWPGE